MVLKELKRIEEDILRLLGEVRSEATMQVLRFPGAAAHRLKQTHRQPSLKDGQHEKK